MGGRVSRQWCSSAACLLFNSLLLCAVRIATAAARRRQQQRAGDQGSRGVEWSKVARDVLRHGRAVAVRQQVDHARLVDRALAYAAHDYEWKCVDVNESMGSVHVCEEKREDEEQKTSAWIRFYSTFCIFDGRIAPNSTSICLLTSFPPIRSGWKIHSLNARLRITRLKTCFLPVRNHR